MAVSALRAALLLAALAANGACRAQAFDPARSRIEFDVRTRVGFLVRGQFPEYRGRVDTLADGRHRVRVVVDADAVVVDGPARYTALARGPQLFDVARHPRLEFVSEPYPADLARTGGPLRGVLSLRGVQREEVFELERSACADPGRGCPVIARGRLRRDDYGMGGWRWALADGVRLKLHVLFDD